MKLHEYQAKRIFGEYGIAVPNGVVVDTPALARAAAAQIGLPVVIKAQVLTGGRGKAGGVKVAKTLDEVEAKAGDILNLTIKDIKVEKVLIDPAANIKHEIYLGVTMDRPNRRALLMASAAGGMDIEEVAATTPEKIIRVHVDPFIGMPDYLARDVAANLGLPREMWPEFVAIALGLVKCYAEKDCSLAEINPLAIVEKDGKQKLVALDGKMVIEDNALYRHPELEAIRNPDEETAAEKTARETGINFISLDGTIGCMVNGAGLAMATMDIVNFYGGTPANFLDVGGGAKADKVASAMRLILSDQKVRGVLINIFGGITRCDEVAKGVVEAMNIVKPTVPIVVRLAGTNQEEGNRILASANMATANTLGEAAQKVVELSK
jgi:succinyl-CoA synthetase beta subunit